MENLNIKHLFLIAKYFEIKNLYFKVINNTFINFNYKIKQTDLNGLYIKSPNIRLIENIDKIDKENYKIIIPLLDCDKFHNIFTNIDKKINKYIKNDIHTSYLIKDKMITIENTKYTYQYLLLDFNIKHTKIYISNNGIDSNIIQLDKLNELNKLNVNNYEINFNISIIGLIKGRNEESKFKYKINKICLIEKNEYNNLEYYKNYLFQLATTKSLEEKINNNQISNVELEENNITKDINEDDDVKKNSNELDTDDEKDSDDETISFPNFELEFDI